MPLDWLTQLRQAGEYRLLPVLMMSGRTDEDDRVAALRNGADDYMCKPFSMREMEARLNNLFRHRPSRLVYSDGYLEIDVSTKRICIAGKAAALTQLEWSLTERLIDAHGNVPQEQLMNALWGE